LDKRERRYRFKAFLAPSVYGSLVLQSRPDQDAPTRPGSSFSGGAAMSRLWTFLGIAVLALALSACGGKEGAEQGGGAGNEAGPTAAAGPVSIDFWHSEAAANEATLQRLIDRFNASQDEVKVRFLYQGNSDDILLKLLNSLRSGDVPALVDLKEADFQVMVDSGAVTPVQEFIDEEGYDLSDFDQKALDYYTADGQLYAMPLGIIFPMLFYNKIPFQEVGLDPDKPPQTLDEARAYSEKLLKVDSAGNVVRSGIALDLGAAYLDNILAEHGDLYVNNNNGRDGRATEAVFNNDTARAFFRWWGEMVDSGLGFNVGRNPSAADALMAVASGRAAMAVAWSSTLRSVLDVLEAGVQGVELGVGPFPVVPGSTGGPGIFGRALWIMNQRPEAEQRAAWKLARWLAEPEQQAEVFAGTSHLPVRLSAYDQEASRQVLEKYPLYQVPVDLFAGTPSTPAELGPRVGPFSKVREIVVQAMEEMVVGGKDPEQALDDAAERATKELQDYNQRVGQ
jgi:sn-glycerol 3-phosphate transport system substrate-binding protein